MQGRNSPGKAAINRDSSCWVYLSNRGWRASDRQWVGDKETWKQTLGRMMTSDCALLQSMQRVTPPAGERRLVLQASSKSTRASFIGAIRRIALRVNRSLKATAALTVDEQANKKVVYECAQRHDLIVIDSGDRCYMHAKGAPPPPQPIHILLSAPIARIR